MFADDLDRDEVPAEREDVQTSEEEKLTCNSEENKTSRQCHRATLFADSVVRMPALCATCSKADAASMCGGCKCTYYCNAICQRKHWKQHKKLCKSLLLKSKSKQTAAHANSDEKSPPPSSDTPCFRIEAIEQKGLGMIASRDIAAGTMVLSEDPILSMVSDTALDIRAISLEEFKNNFAKPLLQRFQSLNKEQQHIINAFSFKHDASIIDKFLNNCLSNPQNKFSNQNTHNISNSKLRTLNISNINICPVSTVVTRA